MMTYTASSPMEFVPNEDGEVRCYICEALGFFKLGHPRPGHDEMVSIECKHYAHPLYVHRRCWTGRHAAEVDLLYLRRTGQVLFTVAGRPIPDAFL